jgi:DNA-binding NarL/FixJ family response regulator
MQAVLTKRMGEILELLVQGKSEKEVATHLGVSPHTVHIHVTRMYARLCVNSRAELLARFYRQQPARRAS